MGSVVGATGLEDGIFGPQWWYTRLYRARISSLNYLLFGCVRTISPSPASLHEIAELFTNFSGDLRLIPRWGQRKPSGRLRRSPGYDGGRDAEVRRS